LARERARHRRTLRLVHQEPASDLPPILTDRQARLEFERLTQSLLDVAIEIMDLADGDPEREPNGDEFEDGDGV